MTRQATVGRCGGEVSYRVRQPGYACPAPLLICQLPLHNLFDAVSILVSNNNPYTSRGYEKKRLHMKTTYTVTGT